MRGHTRDSIYRKNHFINIIMYKSTFIAAAAFMGATLTAFAADPIVMGDENRIIEVGQTYVIEQYKPASGIYNCPLSSKIYLDGAGDFAPYSDPDHTTPITVTALSNEGNMLWFQGEEGATYYFYSKFPLNGANFTLYQEDIVEKPLNIYIMQPEQNERVDFNNYPTVEVTFNQDVKLTTTEATITFTNRLTSAPETLTVRAAVSGQLLRIPMFSALRPLMADGAILTGDPFDVTINGVMSYTGVPASGADEDGNLTFHYLCGSLPVSVVKQSVPGNFLSYWAPGAPEGILTMEFDAPLMDDGGTYIYLGWGNAEGEGEYYAEEIVCEINGNTLSADFTGKLRTPSTMTPAFPNAMYNTMTMDVKNVRDTHGVPVASPGQGTIGSYSFLPTYTLINRTHVLGDFMPENGSLLTDVNNVNVWITGLAGFTFDGFQLTYTDQEDKENTIVIPLSDVKVSNATDNDAEYDFTLPAEVKAGKRVEITLSNVVSIDGYDHSSDVRCIYGGFTVMKSTPANGEELATLAADYEIMITNNLAEKYPSLYVEYQVIDTDPENPEPIVKSAAWMDRQEDGSYTAVIPQEVKLYAGHDYHIVFTAWEQESIRWENEEQSLGSDFIIVKGLTPAYLYSDINLINIDPSVDTVIPVDTEAIRISFDGPVYLGNYDESAGELRTFIVVGSGEILPFAEVTPVEPMEANGRELAAQWVLTLPADYMATLSAPLEISFTAYDQENMQLRGNRGYEENSFFNLVWNNEGMYDSVEAETVRTIAGGNVTGFTVSNANGINVSYNIPLGDAIVTFDGETVAHVADVKMPEGDLGEKVTEITLVLDKELSDNGTYLLSIPEAYFAIGEEFGAKTSYAVAYEFEITEGSAVESIAGETSFTVYNVAGILILDGADADAVRALPAGLYIINGKKYVIR